MTTAESPYLELSIVMPCLNEADTLELCIRKAQEALLANDIVGEVIVADNGSTDQSGAIANSLGAHVVNVAPKGYGNVNAPEIVAAGSGRVA